MQAEATKVAAAAQATAQGAAPKATAGVQQWLHQRLHHHQQLLHSLWLQ